METKRTYRQALIVVPAGHPACSPLPPDFPKEIAGRIVLLRLQCPDKTRLIAVSPHARFATGEYCFKIEHEMLPETEEGSPLMPTVVPRWHELGSPADQIRGFVFDHWEILEPQFERR